MMNSIKVSMMIMAGMFLSVPQSLFSTGALFFKNASRSQTVEVTVDYDYPKICKADQLTLGPFYQEVIHRPLLKPKSWCPIAKITLKREDIAPMVLTSKELPFTGDVWIEIDNDEVKVEPIDWGAE